MDEFPQPERLIASIAQRHAADPRRALTVARELADELAAAGDDVLGHFVAAARDSGMTWAEVGDALGVSKQAVQKRFAVTSTETPIVIGAGLFSRFDTDLAEALIRATLHARATGAHEVTADHLLVGLASIRTARAAAIIRSVAPDLASLLTASRPRPAMMLRRRGTLPFATDARAAFSRLESIAEARNLTAVGTEHLLLALADGPAFDAVAHLHVHGVTAQQIDHILREDNGTHES